MSTSFFKTWLKENWSQCIFLCTACFFIGYFMNTVFSNNKYNDRNYQINARSNSFGSSIDTNYFGAEIEINFGQPIIEYYNEYTIDKPLGKDYPWEHIVEPYKLTTFYVTNPEDGYDYQWYVDEWHKDDGTTMDITFTSDAGTYNTVSVKKIDKDGNIVTNSSVTVMNKYVRREIRELNDQDRELFFSAVAIMQRVPTQVGKTLYGKNYRSKDYFNRLHLYYGGSKSCDHWHQGPGFVTSHITFSLVYEKSLQAINPSLTLPYWDFTLESTFYTPETFRDAGVFTDDWFGDAYCNNSDHTPQTGRFAYNPVMQNAMNFSRIYNPYGFLRSPWNSDPTPYMTRSYQIYGHFNNLKPSGCKEYHHSMGYMNWNDLANQLNSNAHGHIHELMGGSWNFTTRIPTPTTTSAWDHAYEFLHATEAFTKLLWRFGFMECPEDYICSVYEICNCVCSEHAFSNFTIPHVLSMTGIIRSLTFYDKQGNAITDWQNKTSKTAYDVLPGYTEEESDSIFEEIKALLCNAGHIGDMFQATSTNDVTFWVLHPTLDRLWHLMRVNAYNGIIDFDDTWPDGALTCHGHFSTDTTPFKNVFDDNGEVYTNAELYELLNPTQDEFPYIYENFVWSHCSLLGYDMSGTEENVVIKGGH